MTPTRAAARSAGAAQLLAVLPFFLACFAPAPARAQEPSASEARARLWGRITTVSGEVHEGFLRWDRNEACWVDLLNGIKTLHGVQSQPWIPVGGAARNERVIEFGGYRISWEEEEPDLTSVTDSGVRLGHVQRIRVLGEDSAAVELRSGASLGHNERRLTLEPAPGLMMVMTMGSTDLGSALREVLVEAPGGGVVALKWEDLAEVVLGAAPADARPRSARLHGTVEDRWGGSHTGYIAWDDDQALTSDTLEGEEARGRERSIPFREIASMERTVGGALITLTGGDTLRLGWGRDLDTGADLQLSDPGLGQVQVRWRDVERVRFHPPSPDVEAAASRDAFDGGRALQGTVVTMTGEELSGSVLWDADEGATWEILDGRWRDITYDVELGRVASIERVTGGGRGEFRGVRATLLDGRVLELSGSNDVDAENKGVLVRAAEESPSQAEPPPWIRVRWTDFRSIRFHH